MGRILITGKIGVDVVVPVPADSFRFQPPEVECSLLDLVEGVYVGEGGVVVYLGAPRNRREFIILNSNKPAIFTSSC